MYFKVTNEKECHNGFQYQTGLNVLDKPFEPKGSCVGGGLYFTDLENLSKFYSYGVWLRVVIIPEDAMMVKDPAGDKWRANKIILGDKYPLFDVETIKKFNLKMTEDYVDRASGGGHLDILGWWLRVHNESGLELKYTSNGMEWASKNGHLNVIEWWLRVHNDSGLELKYTSVAIDWASEKGHVSVLEWWLKAHQESGLELKYTSYGMDCAAKNGNVSVLEWWLRVHNEFGLELKYSHDAMDLASENGHVNVLGWWLNVHNEFGLELKYTCNDVIDRASLGSSKKNHYEVVSWWWSSGLISKSVGCVML